MTRTSLVVACFAALGFVAAGSRETFAQQNQVTVAIDNPIGGAVLTPSSTVTVSGTALDPNTTSTYQVIAHVKNVRTNVTIDTTNPTNVLVK